MNRFERFENARSSTKLSSAALNQPAMTEGTSETDGRSEEMGSCNGFERIGY
jgi:hypothetical protein